MATALAGFDQRSWNTAPSSCNHANKNRSSESLRLTQHNTTEVEQHSSSYAFSRYNAYNNPDARLTAPLPWGEHKKPGLSFEEVSIAYDEWYAKAGSPHALGWIGRVGAHHWTHRAPTWGATASSSMAQKEWPRGGAAGWRPDAHSALGVSESWRSWHRIWNP